MTKIITVPDKRLRERSEPVTKLDKKVLKLISDLKDALKTQSDPEGVGISAPQIGVNKRIFIIKTGFTSSRDDPSKLQDKVIINPEILEYSKDFNWNHLEPEDHYFEGCLSITGIYGEVKRPWSIKVKYESVEESLETPTGFATNSRRIVEDCNRGVDEASGSLRRPTRGLPTKTEELTGFDAIYFQHEFDHLNGILFTDRVLEQGGKLFKTDKDGEFEPLV